MSEPACICSSSKSNFLLESTPETYGKARKFCEMKGSVLASNLTGEDYNALGSCIPTSELGYRISLVYNSKRLNPNCSGNENERFYWAPTATAIKNCVRGHPLNFTTALFYNASCSLATIIPGSLNRINYATLTLCNQTMPYICQQKKDQNFTSNDTFPNNCKRIPKTAAVPTATTTFLPVFETTFGGKSIQKTLASSTHNTAAIVGVAVVMCIVLLLISFLLFRRSKKYEQLKLRIQQSLGSHWSTHSRNKFDFSM